MGAVSGRMLDILLTSAEDPDQRVDLEPGDAGTWQNKAWQRRFFASQVFYWDVSRSHGRVDFVRFSALAVELDWLAATSAGCTRSGGSRLCPF